MDTHDRKLVKSEQSATRAKETSYNEFRNAYEKKATESRERRAAAAKGKAKAKPKAKPKPKFDFSISHAQTAKHIPRGCSIWRGLTREQWWGHCPPNPRNVTSWKDEGR